MMRAVRFATKLEFFIEDNSLQDEVQVTVIATGFNKEESQRRDVEHRIEAVVNGGMNHSVNTGVSLGTGGYSQQNGFANNTQNNNSFDQSSFQRNTTRSHGANATVAA